MVEMTEDYTRLDWDKPKFLDGSELCSYFGCDAKAEGFLLAPDGGTIGGGHKCKPCADHLVAIYTKEPNEHWTFYEGILYKDPTSSNVLRGFPKEQADAM